MGQAGGRKNAKPPLSPERSGELGMTSRNWPCVPEEQAVEVLLQYVSSMLKSGTPTK